MTIDARIPLMGQGFDLQEIAMNAERIRAARAQRQQAEAETQNKARLADLLPSAVHGDQGAIDQIAGIDPNLFMRLDDRQREAAKAGLADMAAAVRWADTPEKWAQVQQHYGQMGVDLSQYDYSHREQGMLALGKLGSYLDSAPKMEIRATEPGGGLYGITGSNVQTLVAPNDGSHPMGSTAGGGGVPQPGHVEDGYRFKGGNPADPNSWEPVNGGPTPHASGGFLGPDY